MHPMGYFDKIFVTNLPSRTGEPVAGGRAQESCDAPLIPAAS